MSTNPSDPSKINFVLNKFSNSYTMSTSATLSEGQGAVIGDVSATAVYYISLGAIKNVFRFESDAFDVNDLSDVDVRYFTYMNTWPTYLQINPSNAMLDRNDSLGALLQVGIPDKMFVKHDFIRYLASKLFNTPQGVDLFNNEDGLISNLNSIGAQSFQDISSTMWYFSTDADPTRANGTGVIIDGSSNKMCTTDYFTDASNICRELFTQILRNSPSRFNDIDSYKTDLSGQFFMPFLAGDTISYKYTINPAANQNALTGVSEFGGRTYQIKLIVTAGNSELLNTPPS